MSVGLTLIAIALACAFLIELVFLLGRVAVWIVAKMQTWKG